MNDARRALHDLVSRSQQEIQATITQLSDTFAGMLRPLKSSIEDAEKTLDISVQITERGQRVLAGFDSIDLPKRLEQLESAVMDISHGIQMLSKRIEANEREHASRLDALKREMQQELYQLADELLDKVTKKFNEANAAKTRSWFSFGKKNY